MDNIMLFFILFMGVTIPCCTGLCEFPAPLRNDWYSTDKGVLNFTASSLVEYPVFLSSNVSNMTFTCEEINANRYILKGITTFTVFGNQLRAYLCLTITQVSQDVFYYYILNRLASSNNDRIFVRDDNFTVTADDICNRETPYEAGTFIMLVSEGADPGSISRTCPDPILRQYQNVSIVSSDGSARCDDVQLDVCSNSSILNITYQACAPALVYSAGGEFVCLFDLAENGVTYIALWNTDVSLTVGQTYRTSCYAIEEANGVTFGTEVPDRCHYNQTSQYSPPGGVYITMQNVTEICVPTDTEETGTSEESVAFASIVGGVTGGVVFLIAIIICLVGCLCCKKTKATVIVVKEVTKVNHKSKDANVIVDVDKDDEDSIFERDLTTISSAQMSGYSPYLQRLSAKSDKTSPKFRKPTFGSPLYRDTGRIDDIRPNRPSKQNGRLVKNGLRGMEDETNITFPVEQTSLPDTRKDVYQQGVYGGPDDGFVFQDLVVGATDSYKLLVKNMKRGEKNLIAKSPPGKGQGEITQVRSSPSERQSVRNKSNSPLRKQRLQDSENNARNRDSHYNKNRKGHDRFIWTNEDDEQDFRDPDFTGLDSRYGGHPTGPQVYGTVHVDGNTRPPRRKGNVQRTSSFGSSSSKTIQSQQHIRDNSEKGSAVNSQTQTARSSSGYRSSEQKSERDQTPVPREKRLVDISTNTDNTKERVIIPNKVKTGVSIGIQTELENKFASSVPRENSPMPVNDSRHRKLDPWTHPLLNYEYYGSTEVKKSSSVPTVISGYEMAKFNPPNIESSKHHDRMAKRLGLTSNDMVWCIEPGAKGPKRSATYNLGSIMNRNNSHRLGRGKSRTRIVTPWK